MNFAIEQDTFLGLYTEHNLLGELDKIYGKPFNLTHIKDVKLLKIIGLTVYTDINMYTAVLGRGNSYSLISIREIIDGKKLKFLGSMPCNCIISLTGINPSFEFVEEYLEKLFYLAQVPRGFVKDFDKILDFERDLFLSHNERTSLESEVVIETSNLH